MIRFGMALMEMVEQLTKGFIKATGRQPDNLEKLKIQQEAVQRFKDMNKVVDMQGRTLDPSKTIMGGTQEGAALRSGIMKATGAKPIEARANISKYIKDGKPDDDKLNELVDRDMILKEEADSLATTGENYERFQKISAERKNIREIIEDVRKMFPDKKADGGRIGFFMGSKFPKGLATLREMLKFFSKGKEAERPGSEILRLVNPKQFNRFLEDPNIYRKFDVEKGIGAPDLIKNMQADMTKNRTMMIEEILSAAKNIRKSDIGTMERKKEIVAEMMKKGVDRETAEGMADTLATMAETAAGKLDTPKLTDEGILELENVLKNMETGGKKKRDLNADGGRIGYKDGPGMSRRTFMKIFTGLVSIPIIGKVFKPLKTVKGVKNVPVIKTDNVAGKPEWFDTLVNKVIIEGDDVTKKFATGERQTIHTKTLDDGTTVRVTQDTDAGAVRVEYESDKNVFGDPVQMEYKKPLPDEGAPSPTAEFTTAESGPVGRRYGPDDYEIEVDEVGGSSISDLDSDVSKLKEYATGKKPTLKEFVQNKKRKDKAQRITDDPEAQSDAVIARQGEMSGEDYDYASGGIAGLLGE